MLRLIADLNLNGEKRGGREDRRDRGGEIGQRRGKKDGHTQAKKFVCEKCTTYSRGSLKKKKKKKSAETVKMVASRGAEEGGGHVHTCTQTHTHFLIHPST